MSASKYYVVSVRIFGALYCSWIAANSEEEALAKCLAMGIEVEEIAETKFKTEQAFLENFNTQKSPQDKNPAKATLL